MNKTIIVGDPHLGKGLNIGKFSVANPFNSRVIDQLNILNWVLEQGVQHQVARFIITGDVFEDAKPDSALMTLFVNWLKECEGHGIEVHIILGNHDIRRSGNLITSSLDLINVLDLNNIFFYKSVDTLHTPNISFTFLPFRDRRMLEGASPKEALDKIATKLSYEAASIPGESFKVLVGHLALEGSIPIGDEFDDLLNELMCPLNLFQDYDYTIMGHIHRPHIVSHQPHMSHIGSMDLSDFGETDHVKHLVLLDPDAPDFYQTIPIPSRPLRRIKITVPAEEAPVDFILKQIETFHQKFLLEDAIVKIEVKIEDPEAPRLDKEKVEEYVYDLGAYYISGFAESRSVSAIPAAKRQDLDNTIKPRSAIKLWSDLKIDKEEEKSAFLTLATSIIEECGEGDQ